MFEFGVMTYNHGPFSSAANLARYAQRAEALGYDFIGITDHVVIPREDPGAIGHADKHWSQQQNYFDVLQTATYLAAITTRIRIGTSVLILPYRPPLPTAKAIATLDVISGGRLFLGVGTGWWPHEFAALGIADHFASRGDRTDEHLRIFKTCWTEPVPSFAGKFYRFEDIEFSPKPVQRPGPPIWIGGNNPRARRRMAEMGDVWHPNASPYRPELQQPAALAPRRDQIAALFEKNRRDPATLKIALRSYVKVTPPGSAPQAALEGPAGHVIENIQAYKAGGLTALSFSPLGETFEEVLEQMERVAEEVIPHCR
ncbi:MAG: TIGR03619 family F420-dependent LLM class oxidoreductase [Candidatus Lambdaproteobacteria bacterium]|nr:TIGR03619 family F420-dependent LLM class oxidoreductase [Candidatus Lambdaproteobacteria bacterium]